MALVLDARRSPVNPVVVEAVGGLAMVVRAVAAPATPRRSLGCRRRLAGC